MSETRTDTVANTSATAASVSSDLNGMAVLNACQQIMERLKPVQAQYPTSSWNEVRYQVILDCSKSVFRKNQSFCKWILQDS